MRVFGGEMAPKHLQMCYRSRRRLAFSTTTRLTSDILLPLSVYVPRSCFFSDCVFVSNASFSLEHTQQHTCTRTHTLVCAEIFVQIQFTSQVLLPDK